VLFCGLNLVTHPGLFRFGDGSKVVVVADFLFVPQGEVTIGAVAKAGEGDITRSGERLVEETTLAALAEVRILLDGCTVGATPTDVGSLLSS